MDKVKIRDIYRHPRTGAVVVHFEIPELKYASNVNFNPTAFDNLSKEDIEGMVERTLLNIYAERTKQEDPTTKKNIEDAIKELKEKDK